MLSRLLCRHEYRRDMSRDMRTRMFAFMDDLYEETIVPMICPKCGKRSMESNII
jgi:uncharacterized OB-fold protein